MEQIKSEKINVMDQNRQISNDTDRLQSAMNEEKAMIAQYESETVKQKEINARHSEVNIDLQE